MTTKHKIIITGVSGFIGSHVAEHCLKLGMEVIGLDDNSGGFTDNVPEGVEFVEGSINDTALVNSLFEKHQFDYVYHLAAYAAEGLSHFIRHYNYTNNLLGSVNLINAAVNNDVKCFVFTSSIAVYGTNQTPMTEALTPMPEDPYGVSKFAVEQDLKAAEHMFGMPFIVFRPHNVYGERQNLSDKYRNVIGIFMNQIMNNKEMSIFGDGQQTRAFSHVDDVAPYIASAPLVPSAYNEIFNIGADQAYSVLTIAEEVGRALGKEPKITHLEARKEVVHAFASHDKIRETFDCAPPVSLREGIERMANWAKTCESRKPIKFDNIEIERNLPPSWR